jgi:hypothetical protein
MSTTFANSIDSNPIYADRAENDKDGNRIDQTYAKSASLATVATTGAYSDLSGTPSIPTKTSDLTNDSNFITLADVPAQVQSDWTESDSSDPSYIANKPSLATVATTGAYSDLSGTPSIPTKTSDLTNDSNFITLADVPAQVQADWTESDSSDPSYIANKPTLAAVATSGDYADLSGTPTINNVPAVTSSDDAKVLKASYTGGVGSYSWETETGTTYSAGTGIDITSNTISVENPLPASTSAEAGKYLKVDANGDPEWATGGGGGGGVNADWDETDPLEPSYIENKPTPKTLTAGANISISEGQNTLTISAAAGLPASTSADEGKCLVVDSNGDPEWGTGGKTYTGTDGVVVDNVNDTVGLEAPVDLVGGPGITVDNPDGNTVRVSANMDNTYLNQLAMALGIDETVLFDTNDYYGSATLNLSEPFTNFERLKVLAVRANSDQSTPYSFSGPWCEFETAGITINSGKAFGSLTPWIFENKFWKIAVYGATSTTQFTWSSGLQKDMTSTGAGSMDSSQHSVQIKTVIGIHRIANN